MKALLLSMAIILPSLPPLWRPCDAGWCSRAQGEGLICSNCFQDRVGHMPGVARCRWCTWGPEIR